MDYKPGDKICSCTLRSRCGHGAYGEVWLAEDSIGARVAVKIIPNGGRYSQRELAGLKNYKDCNHPNLLKIRYVEITEEHIYCIMDAADGLNRVQGEYQPDTLANRLNKFGRMEGKDVAAMLEGLLDGLEELHKHGLVHRDIKPDNILWVNGRPTLADVGLITQDGKGSLVGTPGFMSPKLLSGQGQADASDDFYALGKVIYCALTALPVDQYPSIPVSMTISLDADLGRAFREVCKNPVRSAVEFRLLLQGENVTRAKKQEKPSRRTRKILFASIALALLLAGGGALLLSGTGRKKMSEKIELDPDSPEAIALDKELESVRAELAKLQGGPRAKEEKDLQGRALAFFREIGFLPGSGDMTEPLLKYSTMTMKEMLMLNSETSRRLSRYSQKLYSLLVKSLLDALDPDKVKERQTFWRKQPGTPQAIQKKMLESDRLMQAAAADFVIRQRIDSILHDGRDISDQEETELDDLLQLRHELCTSALLSH